MMISLLLNASGGDTRGVQICAGVNVARRLTGIQIGLLNIGRTVKGSQIGLVNISRTIDGVPIGLVNIVKTGRHHLDLWTTDTAALNVGLVLGSRTFYTTLALGLNPSRERTRLFAGFGAGLNFDLPSDFFIDINLFTWVSGGDLAKIHRQVPGVLIKGRFMMGHNLTPALGFFAGLTGNLDIVQNRSGGGSSEDPFTHGRARRANDATLSPGYVLGLRFF